MPIMEINIVPLGTASPSVSKYVKKALDTLIKKDNIQYQMTAMGTIIEARSLNTLLKIAKEMHKSVLSDVTRVVTSIRIDDRKDKKSTIKKKMESVYRSNTNLKKEVREWLLGESEKTLRRMGIRKKQAVLDFGCRSGNYTIPAAKIVGEKGRVYGVEKEKNRLGELRGRAEAEHLKNIVLIENPDWKSEIEKHSIDRAILFDVLHPGYFPEKSSRRKIIGKIYEILKPGGVVLVLPTHVTELNLSLKNFIKEFKVFGFHLEDKFTEKLVHDNQLQECEILKFRKEICQDTRTQ
jgi:uncharacterized protein (TIGR00106 family)